MRRTANDPMGLLIAASDAASTARQVQALWGAPTDRQPSGYLSDSATNAEITDELMRQAGYEGGMIPTAGSVNVMRGGGGRPAMVNGISVNRRAEAAFQGADDLLGMASMYRDYKLLGALMNEAQQTATLNKLTSALQDKLGMMRVLPTPAQLGAVPGIDATGTRYNNADLIDRYGDALRKTEMWRQGIIELDTRTMLITSIGNQRMSPTQWVEENTQRYLRSYSAGLEEGKARYAKGTLPFNADMPEQLQTSIWAHQRAELAIKAYNLGMGVPEGPGQLLSMNRWSYDPGGSGVVMRNDLLLDLGPNRSGQILRSVVDGKSSMAEAIASRAQLERASTWHGGASVKAATPQGLWPVVPRRGR